MFASHSGVAFNPARDVPSLAGKVLLITGASGLGRQSAIELARHGRPARIYIASKHREDAAKKSLIAQMAQEAYGEAQPEADAAARTEIRFLDLDLASLESVRKCAAEFVAKEERLDILILNAGVMHFATGTTKEGYEAHFGINYLGHVLLTRLLLPILSRTAERQTNADVRVVVVASEGHAAAPKGGIQFAGLKSDCSQMSCFQRYGQSKLAQIYFAQELGRHHPELKAVAIHPGRIFTGMGVGLAKESVLVRVISTLFKSVICVPISVGVLNHLWAATSSDVVSGTFYEPVGVAGKEAAIARDENVSRALQDWTDHELKGLDVLD